MLDTTTDLIAFIAWATFFGLIAIGWLTTKVMKKHRARVGESTDLADSDEDVIERTSLEMTGNFILLEDYGSLQDLSNDHRDLVVGINRDFKLGKLKCQADELLESIRVDFFSRVAVFDIDSFLSSGDYRTFSSSKFSMLELSVIYKVFFDKSRNTSDELLSAVYGVVWQSIANALSNRLMVTTVACNKYRRKIDEITAFFTEDFDI